MKHKQLRSLWQLAFGDSEEAIAHFFDTAYSPERCQTISMDGQIAAALYWLDVSYEDQKLAYLYAVATHPDFRGRGLCRKLMAQTHAVLANTGYDGAILSPADADLRQMYGRMGYRDCGAVSEFCCSAGEKIPVRSIGREEYALLRRKYLPEGGVIQEGDNLAYLASFAQFFAGEDFVLAAASEGSRFFGMELLGNRDAAPGILAALGYTKATFRVPGEDIPYAMFLPLKEGAKAPRYFGLAFD